MIRFSSGFKAVDIRSTLFRILACRWNLAQQAFGRPRLSLKETVFCSVQKVYLTLSSRRAHSLFDHAVERDQINHSPHFNAVSKLLNREDLEPVLHKILQLTAQPLITVEQSFAIDCSGFRTTSYNEYANQKYNLKDSTNGSKLISQ